MLHKVDEAALVLEGDFLLTFGPLVFESNLETLVQERHDLQAIKHRAGNELGALGLEDPSVGVERDAGASLSPTRGRLTGLLHLRFRLTTVEIGLLVANATAVDLDFEPRRQCVDHRDAHAVQTARHLVAALFAAELTAGVQHGQDHFGSALALVFP